MSPALGGAFVALVGFVVAALSSPSSSRRLRRIFVGVVGRGELEILEQPPRQPGEGSLVVDASAPARRARRRPCPRSTLTPAPAREPRLGRCFAGQPFAGDQPDRGRQRHFLGVRARTIASPRTRASVSWREIVAHPAHGARAERLEPRGLERVEHRAGIGIGGKRPDMQRRVMVTEA